MKALIAMSGGVDSSVSAKLMQDAGYDCIGCNMKLYNNPDAGYCSTKTCCSLSDVEDARSVCARLGMPFYVFTYTEEFKHDVMEKFDAMMEWLANLYVNTLNIIHYMHDKYCYEKIQMALHDREVKR